MSASPAAIEMPAEVDAEEPHWLIRAAFPIVSVSLVLCQLGMWYALYHEHWWLAALLLLPISHLNHGQLIAFHEASHSHLRRIRWINDLEGVFIGNFSFVSFSLYRSAHQLHHAHLTGVRDEEFWPFTDPQSSRAFRIAVALGELFFGLVVTPWIFLRTFLRQGSPIRSRKVRRRIWNELLLMVVSWTALLTLVGVMGWWKYFLGMYLIPAWLAANLQAWRKYIEHVGMTGATLRGGTRSILATDFWGKLVSFTLLHEPLHGIHHQHAGLRYAWLPRYTDFLTPQAEGELPPFRSYTQAALHLIRCLRDPRVGPQWAGRE